MRRFLKPGAYLLALLFMLTVILSALPVKVHAGEALSDAGINLKTSYSNGEIEISLIDPSITGYENEMTLFAKDCTPWASYYDMVDSVFLDWGVKDISVEAFYNFTLLEKLTLPATVYYIGENAFQQCNNRLKTVEFGGSQAEWDELTEMIQPGNYSLLNAALVIMKLDSYTLDLQPYVASGGAYSVTDKEEDVKKYGRMVSETLDLMSYPGLITTTSITYGESDWEERTIDLDKDGTDDLEVKRPDPYEDSYTFTPLPGASIAESITLDVPEEMQHKIYDQHCIYCDKLTIVFRKDISKAKVTAKNMTETGSALKPEPTVVLDGKTLVKGTDYTVSYSNNVKPGKATVTVTGKGGYTGKATGTFTIYGDISKAKVTAADQTATGSALKPAPKVVWNGKTLKKGTDYTVSYSNNVKPGTATVTVTGTGSYRGTAKGTFKIKPKPTAAPTPTPAPKPETVTMYRVYNKNSGEHFYTANKNERNHLVALGWRDEGVGWIAPKTSKTPVYRLYNRKAGDHHYTTNKKEKDHLVSLGWEYEGIGWYSDDAKGVPMYRQYNKNAKSGSHNYTKSKKENDYLVSIGWRAEGIGWYGVKTE